jgi:PAS domain S-box-containing protein
MPAIHVAIRDVTYRKTIEETLCQSEEKFRGIFDTINDGIHINEIDPDGKPGKFIEVNEVACRMLQYNREELLGHRPLDFVAGDHGRPLVDIIKELSGIGYCIFETTCQRKDGTCFPVEIHARRVSFLGK